MDRDAAIAAANKYLGSDADGLWVESAVRITAQDADTFLANLAAELKRDLDELETRLALKQSRDHWQIQFVSMPTDPGDTPQGPRVFVFDEGDISHIRPM